MSRIIHRFERFPESAGGDRYAFYFDRAETVVTELFGPRRDPPPWGWFSYTPTGGLKKGRAEDIDDAMRAALSEISKVTGLELFALKQALQLEMAKNSTEECP
jgi:hypothetical protein